MNMHWMKKVVMWIYCIGHKQYKTADEVPPSQYYHLCKYCGYYHGEGEQHDI